MDTSNIKRGIDFENRAWQGKVAKKIQNAFSSLRENKLNKSTFIHLTAVFLINLFISFPLFDRDVSASFSSSAFQTIAFLLSRFGIIHLELFFRLITIIAISLAPVSFYLFIRKTVLRHDTTALLATLFYILPIPFIKNSLPLTEAILNGDGAHAIVFSFIPLLLLYIDAFIASGTMAWGSMTSLGMAAVSIISPFAFFNLLLLSIVVAVSDGFLGNFRVKLTRFIFVVFFSVTLSLFWYNPSSVSKMLVFSHVQFTLQKFLSVMPLAIPMVPVTGALAFLIFDRRAKLRPLFLGFSFFIIYFLLYTVSKNLRVNGIFTPDRYLIELSFASSFLFALLCILCIELFIKHYIVKLRDNLFFAFLIVASTLGSFFVIMIITNIVSLQKEMLLKPIVNPYNFGIGNARHIFNFHDFSSLIAGLISVSSFGTLFYFYKKSFSTDRKKYL